VVSSQIGNTHLYAALRITVHMYRKSSGESVNNPASCFIVGDEQNTSHKGYLITNRHVLDPDFTGQSLVVESIIVEGYYQGPVNNPLPVPVRFTVNKPEPRFPADATLDVACLDLQDANITDGAVPRCELWIYQLGNGFDFAGKLTVGAQVMVSGYPGVAGAAGGGGQDGCGDHPFVQLAGDVRRAGLRRAAEDGSRLIAGRAARHSPGAQAGGC
jgi:hypothetical protein